MTILRSSRTVVPVALALAASSAFVCQHCSAFVLPAVPVSLFPSLQQEAATTCRQRPTNNNNQSFQFQLFSTTDHTKLEEEIKSMRVGALKQELESYGISTKTFLEKTELVDALVQARKEGKTPVATSPSPSPSPASTASTSTTPSASSSSSSTTTTTSTTTSTADRQARLQEELEKCKPMKVAELKSELESYGVSTKSYFEKSEFVRAVAEARVDGVSKKSNNNSNNNKSSKKKKRRVVDADDDVEEVTAAKVEIITDDSVGPKTKKTRDGSADNANAGNPFGGAGGGNPFGGAGGSPFGPGGGAPGGGGSPFGGGGMGGMDMGNIADMLKGMGGMGGGGAGGNPFAGAGGGANPFAGAGGGNPFGGMGGGGGMGDAMKAAQEAMGNPKVRAVMEKAQKNPKVMAAVQECMGNPMAMTKYMNDPEVGPTLKELQDAMM